MLCQKMKNLSAVISILLLAGCASLPQSLRDDDIGMKLARLTNKAYADPLTDEDVHQVLFATYSRSRDPLMGGEDIEMIHANLIRLRQRLGDKRFSDALRLEDSAVTLAVGWHLGADSQAVDFPLSSLTISKAPKKTFEIEAAYAKNRHNIEGCIAARNEPASSSFNLPRRCGHSSGSQAV